MEPLLVDTDLAARTLAREIRDDSRTRPIIIVGTDEGGQPLVSANRLAGLVSPRIAVAPDPELIVRHLGENQRRHGLQPKTVSVYLPGSARTAVVARDCWTEESENTIRRMLSVGEGLTASIFKVWLDRCMEAPVPLPPFALTQCFTREIRAFPPNARDRLACACLETLLDTSDLTAIRVKTLPTGVTHIQRTRDRDRILLTGIIRSKRRPRTQRTGGA